MKPTIEKRLTLLEQATGASDEPGPEVVIYDPLTGQPLEPIPEGAPALLWLPEIERPADSDNGA